MNIWGWLLKKAGWKVDISVPPVDKCVICVAPHTSNWDFILGLFAYHSIGRKANFLMKDFWFFFPLGYIIKALGGIPVRRGKGGASLTQAIVNDFNCARQLHLAVTPE
ncbi:MAG: 1-acyl-sn-glycerol-3-phosphate acyltransferase, partial [Muribaculaceae bacterium]|nr:1-acyl-sn-glycerol-3-phosphate acyltransferase [Muribaculaceae bacterium]